MNNLNQIEIKMPLKKFLIILISGILLTFSAIVITLKIEDPIHIRIIFFFGSFLFPAATIVYIHRFLKGAVIIINENGIIPKFYINKLIPWDEIDSIRKLNIMVSGVVFDSLTIKLKQPEKYEIKVNKTINSIASSIDQKIEYYKKDIMFTSDVLPIPVDKVIEMFKNYPVKILPEDYIKV